MNANFVDTTKENENISAVQLMVNYVLGKEAIILVNETKPVGTFEAKF